jgi:SAM-dependent methyltransferase
MATLQASRTASLKRAAATSLRRLLHATYDQLDRIQGTHDRLIPPREVNPNLKFTPQRSRYAREFAAGGDRLADMLVAYADLKPSSSVLDIGSGIGRVARSLTKVLSADGAYRGFDVDPAAVAWCQRAYGLFTNFAFAYAPLPYVNVKDTGQTSAEDFVFPYPDATFDVAFSVSVYTHLARPVIDHYLAETSRVLKPGGICANTFFVFDEVALEAMKAGRTDRAYRDVGDGMYACDPGNPNFGVGFTPDVIALLHEAHGLALIPPVRFGTWSGRKDQSYVFQDVVVARRADPTAILPG